MTPSSDHRSPNRLRHGSAVDAAAILGQARQLRAAARDGYVPAPLRGKYIGLLCRDPDSDEARFFAHAASVIGARVTDVRPDRALGRPEDLDKTASLLGRLYDAIECQGLPPAFIARATEIAGIPVFAGLASPTHPTARLAELLDDDDPDADNRLFVLQAALVVALR